MLQLSDLKIAIIGLGYVGLPLAVEFGKQVPVIGFDIHQKRIDELKSGQDHTLEVSPEELKQAAFLSYTTDLQQLSSCNFFIVTVPTPISPPSAMKIIAGRWKMHSRRRWRMPQLTEGLSKPWRWTRGALVRRATHGHSTRPFSGPRRS